jgi:hypothetical protein
MRQEMIALQVEMGTLTPLGMQPGSHGSRVMNAPSVRGKTAARRLLRTCICIVAAACE